MVLIQSFGHVFDLQYLKPTILVFFGSPRLVQNGHFEVQMLTTSDFIIVIESLVHVCHPQ